MSRASAVSGGGFSATPRAGAEAKASSAAAWFQAARNSCDSPLPRFEVQLSEAPSGEKTGRPSNPSVRVTRTGSRSPDASTRNSSKLENPCLLEAKIAYSPEG